MSETKRNGLLSIAAPEPVRPKSACGIPTVPSSSGVEVGFCGTHRRFDEKF
jgi:hypothetical protein